VKAEVGLQFELTFLTQHLGLSIFDPNLGWNNPAFTDESESWVKNFNYIFNPTFGFVHIWPKFGLRQPGIF